MRPQLIGGADARQHEQLGRADGAGAQDDLVALDDEGLAAALDLHPNCARCSRWITIQHDAAGLGVGADGQVEAVARHIDVAQGHAHAHAVDVVLGAQADAGGLRIIHVGMERVTGSGGGLEESLLGRRPGLALVMPHGTGPSVPWKSS